MQQTSELYKKLIEDKNHYFETSLVFNGTNPDTGYKSDRLFSLNTKKRVFSGKSLSFGNCISGEIKIDMKYVSDNFPQRCKIIPFVRVCTQTEHSEWIQKGVYYIDTRQSDPIENMVRHLKITGFDAMIMMEDDYPQSNLNWPAKDINVVKEIANSVDLNINPETIKLISKNYDIQAPFEYSKREVLGFIAAMYGGNFIINDLGELTLITLDMLPNELTFLGSENDDCILIGGVKILV